ncbi:MAG: hypothetical protein HYX60_03950 [Legionella longbeachae]|nr:hypothetical protein [Legionella longbeachae]
MRSNTDRNVSQQEVEDQSLDLHHDKITNTTQKIENITSNQEDILFEQPIFIDENEFTDVSLNDPLDISLSQSPFSKKQISDQILVVTAQPLEPSPENKCYKLTIYTTWGAFCATIATPTALLGIFSELDIPFADLANFNDLKEAFNHISTHNIPKGVIAGLSSEVYGSVMNVLYLGPALTQVKNSFKNMMNCEDFKMIQLINLLWALASSLGPAAISKLTLNFMGNWSYIPFSMQLLAVFASRFTGLTSLSNMLLNKEAKFKSNIFNDLSIASPISNQPTFAVNVDTEESDIQKRVQMSLLTFLDTFYQEKQQEFKGTPHFAISTSKKRIKVMEKITGVSLATLIGLPFAPLSIQSSVLGFETILGINIGKNAHYANPVSLILGTFATIPAISFTMKNNFELPTNIISFGKNLYACYKNEEYVKLVGYSGLFACLTFLSFYSAKGAFGIMANLLKKGYLEYLGLTTTNLGGKILTHLTFWNFFSWSQAAYLKLLNKQLEIKKLEQITSIDYQTAMMLLTYYRDELDLNPLKENHYFSVLNNQNNISNGFSQFSLFKKCKKTQEKLLDIQENQDNHDDIELIEIIIDNSSKL